jgi:hypothetical protein
MRPQPALDRHRSINAGALTAEEEVELLAPVTVTCPPWLTIIAASTSHDVLLRVRLVQFGEKRAMIPVTRYG